MGCGRSPNVAPPGICDSNFKARVAVLSECCQLFGITDVLSWFALSRLANVDFLQHQWAVFRKMKLCAAVSGDRY